MVCLTIFGVNMCVLVLCSLHEVRIKRVELHCKWRLVMPSVTGCLFAVDLQIYCETLSLQQVNNIPKLPGILK